MKKKGFTLVELLVVIAIIALLMGILMPALAKVKAIAYRMICGTHLAGIGKGMNVYAAENRENYPVARRLGTVSNWLGPDGPAINSFFADDMAGAYGTSNTVRVTVGASLYLLVKYAEVSPSVFNCKGDAGAEIFSFTMMPAGTISNPNCRDYPDAWDFGQPLAGPGKCNSYSYHNPYGNPPYAVNATSNPGSPVCADRNPIYDRNADSYRDGQLPGQVAPQWTNSGYVDADRTGNAATHEREGQNVLFVDGHVTFHKTPNVGIAQDNIYKRWGVAENQVTDQIRQGAQAGAWGGYPQSVKDAVLINEKQIVP